jgi:hypothetical protein
MRQPLQQDALDPLVKFLHPVIEVGVAFQIQAIDLSREKLEEEQNS